MRIAYFVHNVDDAAVQKRIALLYRGGAIIDLIGFKRFESQGASVSDSVTVVLGRTYDAKFVLRIIAVLRHMIWPFPLIRIVKRSDAILCRNLEMLALGFVIKKLSGSKAPLSYESLDIHRKLLGQGLSSILLRRIEAFLMQRSHTLITSSPAFIQNYFRPIQGYKGEVCLIENKVLPDTEVLPQAVGTKSAPWVIGWYGIIRCRKSLEILRALTEKFPKIRVVISGRVAEHEFTDFAGQIEASPNISFTGSYTSNELAKIYGQAHFVWAIDYYEEGDNSAWLLPNRLYDSIAFGAVPIALKSVETGRWLQAKGAGIVIGSPAKDLGPLLMEMTELDYEHLQRASAAVDRNDIIHSVNSARQLVSVIKETRL